MPKHGETICISKQVSPCTNIRSNRNCNFRNNFLRGWQLIGFFFSEIDSNSIESLGMMINNEFMLTYILSYVSTERFN